MATLVALLRGINLGAKNKIKMADLNQVYESLKTLRRHLSKISL